MRDAGPGPASVPLVLAGLVSLHGGAASGRLATPAATSPVVVDSQLRERGAPAGVSRGMENSLRLLTPGTDHRPVPPQLHSPGQGMWAK